MPSASHPEPKTGAGADLVQLARETAYDRYIQALLIKPKELRADFLVLAAFHGELARIPVLVREPMMGEIRLQWWHDVLAATEFMAEGAAPDFGSPLANHVAELIARFPNARQHFLAAIEARRTELDVHAFASQSDFETYLDGSGGSVLGVGLKVLGAREDKAAMDALRAAGRAIACADLALRLPRLAALGRLPNLFAEQSAVDPSVRQASEIGSQQQLSQAIDALGAQAQTSVTAYRNLQSRLSTKMNQAVLPLALVEPYFKALQGGSSRQLRVDNPKSPLARFVSLWWAALRQRI